MSRNNTSHQGTLGLYVSGFVLSIVLTLAAYFIVDMHISSQNQEFSDYIIILIIVGLAVTQLMVQLVFFLHMGKESKPRLNLTAFLFMLLVLFILVFGSLWIMNNLDYNMMHDPNIESKIIEDERINH